MIAGVDVSQWQGNLDWASFYADGVRFAFIRLGDGTHVDPSSAAHRDAARRAGIKVAPYWFCRNGEDPRTQAARYVDLAARIGDWDGPLIADYEGASLQGADVRGWIETVIGFLESVYRRQLFYYTGWYILRDSIGQSDILKRHLLWLPGGPRYNEQGAHVSTASSTLIDAPPGYFTAAQQWNQYGRAGTHDGNLDLNLMSEDAFRAFFGQGVQSTPTPVDEPVFAPPAPGQKIVAIAASQNGVKESPPNSNTVLFWDWWENANGVTEAWEVYGPWCAAFVSWAYDQAGFPLPPIQRDRGGFMGVPAGVKYAIDHGEAFMENPLPGDIVFYSWLPVTWDEGLPWVRYVNPNTGAQGWEVAGDHVGIFSHMEGDRFMCWEGNTSVGGSQDDGGAVHLRDRYRNQIVCFWRPKALAAHSTQNFSINDEEDMAQLTIHEGRRRPSTFTSDGTTYKVWDIAWLPENGRIIKGPSGRAVVQWSAVSVALVDPADSGNGPVPVFVYDENGCVGRLDVTNQTALYFPRLPGRQSFVTTSEVLVQGRECLMA